MVERGPAALQPDPRAESSSRSTFLCVPFWQLLNVQKVTFNADFNKFTPVLFFFFFLREN